MNKITKIAIIYFSLAVATGTIYFGTNYCHTSNLISELGAQKTPYNYIMVSGFLILGIGLAINAAKKPSAAVIPFAMFGLFMAMAGIFKHKPVDPNQIYSITEHNLHSAAATFAGISITIGFVWQGIMQTRNMLKSVCFYLAFVCFAFPMLMLYFPSYQGIFQRLMYLQVFIWLWTFFPDKIIADKSQKRAGAGHAA